MSNALPSRELRVGVVGLGFGAAVHVPALQSLPAVKVVGIAGSSRARACPVAERLSISNACGSLEELLDVGLDAITLALPPDQVETAVRAALERRVAILCEKPLGVDAVTAAELAGLAADRISAMDFQFAELETFLHLRKTIDENTLGRVRHIQVVWLTESWAHRNRAWSWKTDAVRGGGAIALFGSHLFFLAEWLLGPAHAVLARMGEPVACDFAPIGSDPAEDLVHCRFEHSGGAIFAATFGNASPGSSVHRWTVVFERGSINLENNSSDYMSGFTLTARGGSLDGARMTEPGSGGDGRVPPFQRLVSRFLEGVRTGRQVHPDLLAGARAMTIDAAVRASAAQGVLLAIPHVPAVANGNNRE